MTDAAAPTATTDRTVVLRSAGMTVAVVVVWAVLAWNRPAATFHFAPLIAALAGPWLVQTWAGRQPPTTAFRLAGLSLGLVAVGTAALAAADLLRGPTFWSDSGAWFEGLVFATIGATIGWRIVRR